MEFLRFYVSTLLGVSKQVSTTLIIRHQEFIFYSVLFHHSYHQRAENVKFRAENMFLLPGTSTGQQKIIIIIFFFLILIIKVASSGEGPCHVSYTRFVFLPGTKNVNISFSIWLIFIKKN